MSDDQGPMGGYGTGVEAGISCAWLWLGMLSLVQALFMHYVDVNQGFSSLAAWQNYLENLENAGFHSFALGGAWVSTFIKGSPYNFNMQPVWRT